MDAELGALRIRRSMLILKLGALCKVQMEPHWAGWGQAANAGAGGEYPREGLHRQIARLGIELAEVDDRIRKIESGV